MALALSPGGFGIVDVVILVLFAVTLPWMVVGFWNATIGFLIMRFARPDRSRDPGRGRHSRQRADDGIDRDPAVHPQRGAGAHGAQSRADAGRPRAARASRPLSCLCAERHQRRRRSRPRKRRASARLPRSWRGRIAITYRRRDVNTGFKAGNIRDFCERWGDEARICRDARRRQLHDRRRHPAAGAHHAGRPQARHPAGTGRRAAFDQRFRAHVPVRHAARHALLHHRQRLVAGRLRSLLGPQRGAAA